MCLSPPPKWDYLSLLVTVSGSVSRDSDNDNGRPRRRHDDGDAGPRAEGVPGHHPG